LGEGPVAVGALRPAGALQHHRALLVQGRRLLGDSEGGIRFDSVRLPPPHFECTKADHPHNRTKKFAPPPSEQVGIGVNFDGDEFTGLGSKRR